MRGLLPERDPDAPEDGLPGAVRAAGCAAAGTASRARCCSIAATRERGLINPPAVDALLDDHRAGRRAGGDAIWALLNLELWYRTFIDGDGIQTLPDAGPLTAGTCRVRSAEPASTDAVRRADRPRAAHAAA